MVVDIPASPDGIAPDQLAARRSLAISVAAMAVVMYVNAHPDVSAGLVIGFAAYALAFAILIVLLCRPFFVSSDRLETARR
jgi:hypothetical protein